MQIMWKWCSAECELESVVNAKHYTQRKRDLRYRNCRKITKTLFLCCCLSSVFNSVLAFQCVELHLIFCLFFSFCWVVFNIVLVLHCIELTRCLASLPAVFQVNSRYNDTDRVVAATTASDVIFISYLIWSLCTEVYCRMIVPTWITSSWCKYTRFLVNDFVQPCIWRHWFVTTAILKTCLQMDMAKAL